MPQRIQLFKSYLSQSLELSDELWADLLEHTLVRKIKKSDYLFKEGEPTIHLFFILSGAFRMFYLNDGFKEYTVKFGFENSWISDLEAIQSEAPSKYHLQAIENAVVVQIAKCDMDVIFKNHPNFHFYYLAYLEKELVKSRNRIVLNIAHTAEDRFDNFVNKYAKFTNRISDRHIASYIGVTPEFFSKLKKRKLREYLNLD